jgi:phosphoribosylanthranilate isomerase
VSTAIKFCGLTRVEDARLAAELGASFVGAVFAGGPRVVTADHAHALFRDVRGPRRVGVFGDQRVEDIARTAAAAGLDVVQLHADPGPELVTAVQGATGLETWAAMRIANKLEEADLDALISCADAIVFDSRVAGALGGSGRAFDWEVITNLLDQHRRDGARFVLAGGLTPALVPRAIAALRPDVLDVSSGVESAPGVKDHELMRAFAAAASNAP